MANVGMGTDSNLSLSRGGRKGSQLRESMSMWGDRAGAGDGPVSSAFDLVLSLYSHLPPTMPFERYLRHPQEPTSSSSSSPSINDYAYVQSRYPSSLGSALGPLDITSPLPFQMPQFMLDGPPTVAPGGGAEVLPAGFASPESFAFAWIANAGFAPNASGDVYVRLQ